MKKLFERIYDYLSYSLFGGKNATNYLTNSVPSR